MNLSMTFNQNAAAFEQYRIKYPEALYRDILAYAQICSDSSLLEIGMGSGQATEPFLAMGCSLTAIEQGDKLAAIASEKFACYPNFKLWLGRFEEFDCSERYDLIFSASAFHWIEEDFGYRRVHELLKEGGIFVRFASHPEYRIGQEALYEDIQKLYDIYKPGPKPVEYTEADAASRAATAERYDFSDCTYRMYELTVPFTAAAYAGRLSTYSDHAVLPEEVKREFFAKVEEVINAHGGILNLRHIIDLQLARKG